MSNFTHANYDAWKMTDPWDDDDGVFYEVMEDLTSDRRLCPYCKTKLIDDKSESVTYCPRCSEEDGYDPALSWTGNRQNAIEYKVQTIRDARNDPT